MNQLLPHYYTNTVWCTFPTWLLLNDHGKRWNDVNVCGKSGKYYGSDGFLHLFKLQLKIFFFTIHSQMMSHNAFKFVSSCVFQMDSAPRSFPFLDPIKNGKKCPVISHCVWPLISSWCEMIPQPETMKYVVASQRVQRCCNNSHSSSPGPSAKWLRGLVQKTCLCKHTWIFCSALPSHYPLPAHSINCLFWVSLSLSCTLAHRFGSLCQGYETPPSPALPLRQEAV